MYKKQEDQLLFPDDFFLPFGGRLNPENRWVKLTEMIPWWHVEEAYASSFGRRGPQAESVRMALGALIIQRANGHKRRRNR